MSLSFWRFPAVVASTFVAMAAARSLHAAGQSDSNASVRSAQDSASVLDGVFTAEQAQAGAELFEGTCIRCHNPEQFVADGQYSPAARFKNLGEMFEKVSTRMPADDPGSLPPEQYAAAMSYILTIAGYPAGQTELPAEAAKLLAVRLVPLPASAAR